MTGVANIRTVIPADQFDYKIIKLKDIWIRIITSIRNYELELHNWLIGIPMFCNVRHVQISIQIIDICWAYDAWSYQSRAGLEHHAGCIKWSLWIKLSCSRPVISMEQGYSYANVVF